MKNIRGLNEKQIENSILHYLKWRGIYAWKTKTVGTYSPRRGRFLRGATLYLTGVADIIGILDGGRLFAIEVKTPQGTLQENQKLFLSEIKARGGVAFVARSIDDVELNLKILQREK